MALLRSALFACGALSHAQLAGVALPGAARGVLSRASRAHVALLRHSALPVHGVLSRAQLTRAVLLVRSGSPCTQLTRMALPLRSVLLARGVLSRAHSNSIELL